MATEITDQQSALKDAMARAKEIAAKLQQGNSDEGSAPEEGESRKRSLIDTVPETVAKKTPVDESTDTKAKVQKVVNNAVRRGGLGSMLVEEITVPNKLVGLIIGRGGEMINKLQTESGAKVQVAPDPPQNTPGSDERQITITGSADSVNKAKNLIDEIRNGGKIPERLLVGSAPGEFSVQLTIPKAKVGLIIGKGGETIKGLQERAGCKMMMFQDGVYANAPEKPLRISGEQGSVMFGKQLVQDLLAGRELESLNREHGGGGPDYKEIDVPRPAVGLIIGAKGANIHQIQMETGCRVQFKNEMEGPTKTAMLTGEPHQVAAAEQKIMEIISGNMMGGPQGPRPQMNGAMGPRPPFNGPMGPRPGWDTPLGPQGPVPPQGWAPGPPRPAGRNPNLPPDHKEMLIEVPANKCGVVIGKGGETIKFIKNETKANIQLNRDIPENLPFKVFIVQGTDEMIEKVLGMIREKIGDQSIMAKPVDGGEPMPQGQNQWGAPPNVPWTPQPQQNQWNQQPQQPWPGQQQPVWGQQQPVQQGTWGQPAQPVAPGWNQPQPMQQPSWDPQQQWQQQNATPQGQWPAQQQWGQPAPAYQAPIPNSVAQPNPLVASQAAQAVPNAVAPVNTSQAVAQTTAQPDYTAAWALYYQQQQQYYAQYAMQQPASVSVAPAATAAAVAPQAVPPVATQTSATPVSANSSQSQAMADYQAKLKEYYKQFGQQPPQ